MIHIIGNEDSEAFSTFMYEKIGRHIKAKSLEALKHGYAHFIVDIKNEQETREIIRHVTRVDAEFNYDCIREDIVSEKYDIDGLVRFVILNYETFDAKAKWNQERSMAYSVLCMLMDSGINHCIYRDAGGKISNIDIRTKPNDYKKYSLRFRNDLKMVMRSSWEANVARVFKYMGVEFEYEKDSFGIDIDFSGNTQRAYFPDFFLENNIIVEVKGFWDSWSRTKVLKFKEKYKEYNLLIIDSDMYYTLEFIYSEYIPEWEFGSTEVSGFQLLDIVGITRKERLEPVSRLQIGDEIFLKREPNNAFDRNAIMALNRYDELLGYVSKDWASIYADKIDMGMTFKATVHSKIPKVIKINIARTNHHKYLTYDFLEPDWIV